MLTDSVYQLIAAAISYPHRESSQTAQELMLVLGKIEPALSELLAPYVSYLKTNPQGVLEEDYTRTFDVQAVCPLEIGYILFGEDYKRGEFLVRMSDLHTQYATVHNPTELADFLPNILQLVDKMEEDEFKKDFIEKLLMPALTKMLNNFDAKTEANPYSLPLRALFQVLAKKHTMNPRILEVRHE